MKNILNQIDPEQTLEDTSTEEAVAFFTPLELLQAIDDSIIEEYMIDVYGARE